MKVSKENGGITWVMRDDGIECMIAKDLRKAKYSVYVRGMDTGYTFKSLKKAIGFCEFDF